MVNFDQVYIRNLGFSLIIRKLQTTDALPLYEQVFCAIIRRSTDARRLLSQLSSEGREQMLSFVERHGFAGFLFAELIEQSLVEIFNQAEFADKAKFTTRLSLISANENVNARKCETRFRDVLSFLEEHLDSLLWVKGAHLCRAIYPQKEFRQFGDFDVIAKKEAVEQVIAKLEEHHFVSPPFAANTNQFGAGPTLNVADLFLSPIPDWIPTSAVTMKFGMTYEVDIKLGPLDRGIQVLELDRFFQDAQQAKCLNMLYKAPSNVDHLMIMLRNLEKDRFRNWKSLMDIHLLCKAFSDDVECWQQFVRRCEIEGIKTCAWAGLSLAINRFHSPVPTNVIQALCPGFRTSMTFLAAPGFTWNSCGLPSLLFNALTAEDCPRKLSFLAGSFFPSQQFLQRYFNAGSAFKSSEYCKFLVLHWLVLIMPAGLTRRSFGKRIWTNERMLKQGRN